MAHVNHYDVIVIGSGPGGEGAAMGLTKAGLNVAIVEKESSVGGGCTHWVPFHQKHCVMPLAASSNLIATRYFVETTPAFMQHFLTF